MKNKCISLEKKKDLVKQVAFLKALSDETRLHILCFLSREEKCVCEIINFLELPQNLVSHHLKVLREAGFVEKRKEGLQVFYKSNDTFMNKNIKSLKKLIIK